MQKKQQLLGTQARFHTLLGSEMCLNPIRNISSQCIPNIAASSALVQQQ